MSLLSEHPTIAVTALDAVGQAAGEALARELGLPWVPVGVATPGRFLLVMDGEKLLLRDQDHPREGAVGVDFVEGAGGYRLRHAGGERLLARAVGSKDAPRVIDATAGLGQDGFLLAAQGCRVVMLERSPVVAALLRDGLARAARHPETAAIAHRVTLHAVDSLEHLASLSPEERPDVVYLDPMFPEREKSALVKKELRRLREVVGEDGDGAALLLLARNRATRRVVVKRPRLAPTIPGPKPDFSLDGKAIRYDVYLVSQERNT